MTHLLSEEEIHMALMNAYGAISDELANEATRDWVRRLLSAEHEAHVKAGWVSKEAIHTAMLVARTDEREKVLREVGAWLEKTLHREPDIVVVFALNDGMNTLKSGHLPEEAKGK